MSSLGFTLASPLAGGGPVARSFAYLSAAVATEGAWESSSDITPPVLLQAINYGLIEAYRAMVNAWADYYTQEATFTIVAGTDRYPLVGIAPQFYKLRHIDVSADGQRFVRCYPHDIEAAARWSGTSQADVRSVRYRMQAGNLVFAPPPGAGVGKIYWIPTPPQFASVNDASTIQFDAPSEELLVVHLAMKYCIRRSDLSTVEIERQIAEDTAGLRTDADARDAGEPFTLDPRGPRRRYGPIDDDGCR